MTDPVGRESGRQDNVNPTDVERLRLATLFNPTSLAVADPLPLAGGANELNLFGIGWTTRELWQVATTDNFDTWQSINLGQFQGDPSVLAVATIVRPGGGNQDIFVFAPSETTVEVAARLAGTWSWHTVPSANGESFGDGYVSATAYSTDTGDHVYCFVNCAEFGTGGTSVLGLQVIYGNGVSWAAADQQADSPDSPQYLSLGVGAKAQVEGNPLLCFTFSVPGVRVTPPVEEYPCTLVLNERSNGQWSWRAFPQQTFDSVTAPVITVGSENAVELWHAYCADNEQLHELRWTGSSWSWESHGEPAGPGFRPTGVAATLYYPTDQSPPNHAIFVLNSIGTAEQPLPPQLQLRARVGGQWSWENLGQPGSQTIGGSLKAISYWNGVGATRHGIAAFMVSTEGQIQTCEWREPEWTWGAITVPMPTIAPTFPLSGA